MRPNLIEAGDSVANDYSGQPDSPEGREGGRIGSGPSVGHTIMARRIPVSVQMSSGGVRHPWLNPGELKTMVATFDAAPSRDASALPTGSAMGSGQISEEASVELLMVQRMETMLQPAPSSFDSPSRQGL